MDDFRIIYRLLKQIRAFELLEEPDWALFAPEVLKTSAMKRDNLALKLLDADYIDGLRLVEGINGMTRRVILWEYSSPSVTLKGLEYMEENSLMRRAEELAKGILQAAT